MCSDQLIGERTSRATMLLHQTTHQSREALSACEGTALRWGACVRQTDLRVEAVHLKRFYNNFASVRSSVTPPLPVPGMDTEAVLVETFEPGARTTPAPACIIMSRPRCPCPAWTPPSRVHAQSRSHVEVLAQGRESCWLNGPCRGLCAPAAAADCGL